MVIPHGNLTELVRLFNVVCFVDFVHRITVHEVKFPLITECHALAIIHQHILVWYGHHVNFRSFRWPVLMLRDNGNVAVRVLKNEVHEFGYLMAQVLRCRPLHQPLVTADAEVVGLKNAALAQVAKLVEQLLSHG